MSGEDEIRGVYLSVDSSDCGRFHSHAAVVRGRGLVVWLVQSK